MRVTAIIPFHKYKSKVFLDEDFAFVLYHGELRRYHLAEDSEMSEEQYQEIMEKILPRRGRERALYLLKNSDKTEQEIRRKLGGDFYPAPVIDRVVDFLMEYRFIDDRNYGRRYIEACSKRKSRRQLQADLQQKGLSRELIGELLEHFPIEEELQIRTFLQKKRFDRTTADRKERAKLTAALGRKGFSFDLIRKMMGEDSFF